MIRIGKKWGHSKSNDELSYKLFSVGKKEEEKLK